MWFSVNSSALLWMPELSSQVARIYSKKQRQAEGGLLNPDWCPIGVCVCRETKTVHVNTLVCMHKLAFVLYAAVSFLVAPFYQASAVVSLIQSANSTTAASSVGISVKNVRYKRIISVVVRCMQAYSIGCLKCKSQQCLQCECNTVWITWIIYSAASKLLFLHLILPWTVF